MNQFPENFNYTIYDDALELGTISISEQPVCNYPQTIEFRVTKDGELVDRTFLTQDSEGIVTMWSDRPSDEGLYRVKIIVSQDDGFGVQISDYTEFVLDVQFEIMQEYTVESEPVFVDLDLYQFSWTLDILDASTDVTIDLPKAETECSDDIITYSAQLGEAAVFVKFDST